MNNFVCFLFNVFKYYFIVETVKYTFKISCAGHKDFIQDINVYDKSDYKVEIEANFVLEPVNWKPPVTPKKVTAKK